jgi:hypothetical protein
MNKTMLIALLFGLHGAAAMAQVAPLPGGLNPGPTSPQSSLPPGLYVQVIDGLIHVTNPGGAQNFAAGQFGFTPSFNQPPIMVPQNPGLIFTPPPTFSTNPAGSTSTASSGPSTTVDCEVR